MSPRNRVQRFDFEKWEPMDRLSPKGTNDKAPYLYGNAAFDSGGALSVFGRAVALHATAALNEGGDYGYLLDMDDTGLVALARNQTATTTPSLVNGVSLIRVLPTGSSYQTGRDITSDLSSGAAVGLYEGVGMGNTSLSAIFDADGAAGGLTGGTGTIGTVSGVAAADAASTLAEGTYFIYGYSFTSTPGGLFLLGTNRAEVVVAAGQKLTVTVAWATQPDNTILYVYVRRGRKPNPILLPIIGGWLHPDAPPEVAVEGDAYLIGTGSDGATFTINYDPVGQTLPDRSFGVTPEFFPSANANFGALPAVSHQGRFYSLALGVTRRGGQDTDTTAALIAARETGKGGRLIAFSDTGFVNFGASSNWFVVPLRGAHATITGLVSSPAGLLIFSEQEVYLMTGDPATGDFAVQLVSGGLGSDSASVNLRPRRMGGTVLFVHEGRLMAYTLGMGDVDFGGALSEVTERLLDPDLTVVNGVTRGVNQYLPLPALNSVGVIFGGGDVAFYRFDTGHWTQYEDSLMVRGTFILVPKGGGALFVQAPTAPAYRSTSTSSPAIWGRYVRLEAPIADSEVVGEAQAIYEHLALGDRGAWKTWLYVEVMFSGPLDATAEQRVVYTPSGGASDIMTLVPEESSDAEVTIMRGYFPAGLTSQWLTVRFYFELTGLQRVRSWAIYAVPRSRAR